jgi:hypothetical protein
MKNNILGYAKHDIKSGDVVAEMDLMTGRITSDAIRFKTWGKAILRCILKAKLEEEGYHKVEGKSPLLSDKEILEAINRKPLKVQDMSLAYAEYLEELKEIAKAQRELCIKWMNEGLKK